VFFDRATIRVRESSLDESTVLVARLGTSGEVAFRNEGWGDVRNPLLEFDIRSPFATFPSGTNEKLPYTAPIESFDEDAAVDITDIARRQLPGNDVVGVVGNLRFDKLRNEVYTGNGLFQFQTTVRLEPAGMGVLAPPSWQYEMYLEAGRALCEVTIPISHALKSGDFDRFLLRVATNKSCWYECSLLLGCNDGRYMESDPIRLHTFVPRSQASRVESIQKFRIENIQKARDNQSSLFNDLSQSNHSPDDASRALRALECVRADAVPPIIDLIDKLDASNPKSSNLWMTAVHALGVIGGTAGVEALTSLLHRQQNHERAAMICELWAVQITRVPQM
jgi:hypothetical protein